MNRLSFSSIFIYIFFFATCSFSQTIIVSTGEWIPWTGENINKNGFVCHIVKEIFNNHGYQVEFRFYPWKRAYNSLINGRVHASAYWYISENRKQKCYYSDAITEEKIVFFHKKLNPMKEWNKLEDLKDYRIGVSRGNTYTDEFWRLSKEGILKFDMANSDLLSIKKLIHGRVDIVPSSLIMVYQTMRKEFAPGIVETLDYNMKPLTTTTGHLLFPKSRLDSKKYLEIFNKGLKEIKNNGTYHRYMDDLIANKYN